MKLEFYEVLDLIKDKTFPSATRFCSNCSIDIDQDHYFIVGNEIKCSSCGLVLGIIPEVEE